MVNSNKNNTHMLDSAYTICLSSFCYQPFLSVGFLRYLNQVFSLDLPPDQHWHCTFAMTGVNMTIMCSTLLVVSMTFERFYSIIRPHKAASFNTVKKARTIITCIVLFSIIYNVPHLFVSVDRGRACIPYGKGMDVIHGQLYYWLSFLI